MRIALDVSQAAYSGTGVGRFTSGLANYILDNPHGVDWVFVYGHFRQPVPQYLQKNLPGHSSLITIPFPPKVAAFVWNRLHILPIESFTGPIDWFISSDFSEPPAKAKKATIIHDAAYKRYPETLDPFILSNIKRRLQWVKKESTYIFADSLSTIDDLKNLEFIPEEKLILNYPGVDALPHTKEDSAQVLKKYHITTKYLLFVGKHEPRKNIPGMLEAFAVREDQKVQLVMVGVKGWGVESLLPDGVQTLGFVPDEDLAVLYRNAVGLVFPSLWEGFGYPAIEAMHEGCPVLLSNTSSLAEIGKKLAIRVDPNNVADITKGLNTLISTRKTRELSQQLKNEAMQYSWERYLKIVIKTLSQ